MLAISCIGEIVSDVPNFIRYISFICERAPVEITLAKCQHDMLKEYNGAIEYEHTPYNTSLTIVNPLGETGKKVVRKRNNNSNETLPGGRSVR